MIAPRLSSQLDPSRSSSYDPDDFHSNGSDEPHEDEEPVVRGSAPGPDPIFMLAGGARPACLLPGHLFIDVNEIERSIFEDEGFGADARATVTEIAEAAEDDGGNADGNNNDDDTVDLERTETADEASDYNTDSYDADDGSYYDSPSDFDDDDVSDISGGIDPVYFPSANVRLAFGSDSTGENSPASSSSDFDTSYEVVNH
jgi:hypothetical protein